MVKGIAARGGGIAVDQSITVAAQGDIRRLVGVNRGRNGGEHGGKITAQFHVLGGEAGGSQYLVVGIVVGILPHSIDRGVVVSLVDVARADDGPLGAVPVLQADAVAVPRNVMHGVGVPGRGRGRGGKLLVNLVAPPKLGGGGHRAVQGVFLGDADPGFGGVGRLAVEGVVDRPKGLVGEGVSGARRGEIPTAWRLAGEDVSRLRRCRRSRPLLAVWRRNQPLASIKPALAMFSASATRSTLFFASLEAEETNFPATVMRKVAITMKIAAMTRAEPCCFFRGGQRNGERAAEGEKTMD